MQYFDYWLPIFKRMYFKFKLLGDIKAIVELEDEIWKNWNLSREDKKKYNHPTIKPLNIIKNFINNSSNENDIVLDCFCGSGTTCVAAKETGRRFIGMEINPKYYKIAVDRLNGINANGQTSIFTDFEKME